MTTYPMSVLIPMFLKKKIAEAKDPETAKKFQEILDGLGKRK